MQASALTTLVNYQGTLMVNDEQREYQEINIQK